MTWPLDEEDKNALFLIKMSSFLVFGLGALIFSNFLHLSPPLKAETGSSSQRSPAGVTTPSVISINSKPLPAVTLSDDSQAMVQKLRCLKPGVLDLGVLPAKHVRFRLQECPKLPLTSLRVKNRSTGLIASVFSTKAQEYSTDYILLEEGLNRIQISQVLESGEKQLSELKIMSVTGNPRSNE